MEITSVTAGCDQVDTRPRSGMEAPEGIERGERGMPPQAPAKLESSAHEHAWSKTMCVDKGEW